jgi:phosphate transport system substrate-binding protein
MRILRFVLIALLFGTSATTSIAQNPSEKTGKADVATNQKIVVITGNRFSYKLIQQWIDDYNKVRPDVQLIIEARGSNDPAKYQILAEVYPQEESFRQNREYINVARYAVLPVANANSGFAKYYGEKGLDRDLIRQIYFHDIYADKENQKKIKAAYTVYTRMQKAGVPFVFAKYFEYEQKDITGNAIAGADEHLVKAVLRDSAGITYLPLPLIYDPSTKSPIAGLRVIPVDFNGNGRVNDEEKFYATLGSVLSKLESSESNDIKNIPVEYLHLSIDKQTVSAEAVDFLKWVNENGQRYLHDFGYLLPETKHYEKAKFDAFAEKHKAGGR